MKRDYFNWDSEFVTGLNIVDEQHRGLIEIINEVIQLSFNNLSINEVEICSIYDKLTHYILEHFGTEEKLMKEHLVDNRHKTLHFQAHEEFKEMVGFLFSDLSVLIVPEKLNEVSEFLIRWLAYHILNVDQSLVRQLNHIIYEGMTPKNAFEVEDKFIEASTEPLLKALKALFLIISEKNRALTIANFELEEKVCVRTNELLEANSRLELMTMQDELTGLPNRRYVMKKIDDLTSLWKRYGAVYSLLFIDIDKFKQVNDIHGHEYGDKVLKWISNFLRTSIRESDEVCRLGGDEFIVICAQCDGQSAYKLGNKIGEMCKVADLKELSNCWSPSLSIGVAEIDMSCETTSDILRKADYAMYISKSEGGGHTVKVD